MVVHFLGSSFSWEGGEDTFAGGWPMSVKFGSEDVSAVTKMHAMWLTYSLPAGCALLLKRKSVHPTPATKGYGYIRLPLPKHGSQRPWSADDIRDEPNTYETITCTACGQLHLVNAATGRALGDRQDD
jgi:hypothetical protein